MTRCQLVPVCERCGAVHHGNIGCIVCLRHMKRTSPEAGDLLRVLIKIAARREKEGR